MTYAELKEKLARAEASGVLKDDAIVTMGQANENVEGFLVAESEPLKGPKVTVLNLSPIPLDGLLNAW